MLEKSNIEPQISTVKISRNLSLDVLRGMTVALMIVVNTPGSWETVYTPFRHSAWHGITITDIVFPSFLFVVGNSLSFSMRKIDKNQSIFLKKVLKRTILIFLLGLFLNAFPFVNKEGNFIDLFSLRFMGVLQRIALCYGLSSLVIYYFKERGAFIFGLSILIIYWGILYFGGNAIDSYSLAGNVVLKFDLLILPAKNLYHGFGIAFDPEGILSTIPSLVNVIGGFLAGNFIQKQGSTKKSIFILSFAGLFLIGLGFLWNIYLPINKALWTSSYVLCAIGMDLFILATIMLFIEILGYKKWTYFFEVFGKNPLFIYILSGVIISMIDLFYVNESTLKVWIYYHFYVSWLNGKNASLLFALSYMFLLWGIAYVMDKKRIYIKL